MTARISVVAAARPNFMKVSPVIAALEKRVDVGLVHTGQHYDDAMSDMFFGDLGLRAPDVNLAVGSGTHAEQTGRAMIAYERHLVANPAEAIVVVGDVNSTLAAALAGVKLGIPVAHVEAGLRSGDWSMPEEVNRAVVDRVSSWLFTPSEDANRNLRAEGIDMGRIHLVGNVMIDTLYRILPEARAAQGQLRERLSLPGGYAVATLHRPSNVDSPESLASILAAMNEVSERLEICFAVHPRTREQMARIKLELAPRVRVLEPMGYRDFLALLDGAAVVLTDSGGIQEETSVLGIPCVTLRDSTERPITCSLGTNRVVGTKPPSIVSGVDKALAGGRRQVQIPMWDGHAAERIADVLLRDLGVSR